MRPSHRLLAHPEIARQQPRVRLVDGTEGILFGVRRPTRTAKVIVAGRHRTVSIDDIAHLGADTRPPNMDAAETIARLQLDNEALAADNARLRRLITTLLES